MPSFFVPEHRCACGNLLFKGVLMLSELQIKCKRCKKLVTIGEEYQSEDKNHYAIITTMGLTIVDVSPNACDVLGYTRDELIGHKPIEFDPLLKAGAFDYLYTTGIRKTLETFSVESMHQKKNGEVYPVRIKLKFQRVKAQVYILTFFDKLEKKTKLLTDPNFPNNAHMTQRFNAEVSELGTLTYVSKELSSLLGQADQPPVGSSLFSLYPLRIRKKREEEFENMIKEKAFSNVSENLLLTKNGKTIKVDTDFAPKFRDDGRFDGFIMLNRLIS